MQRSLWAVSTLPVLALLWAALHDIMKGEPDLSLEWAAAALCLPLLAFLTSKALR